MTTGITIPIQQYYFAGCKIEMNYGMFFSFFEKDKIKTSSIKIDLMGQAGLPFYYRKRMQYHVHLVVTVHGFRGSEFRVQRYTVQSSKFSC